MLEINQRMEAFRLDHEQRMAAFRVEHERRISELDERMAAFRDEHKKRMETMNQEDATSDASIDYGGKSCEHDECSVCLTVRGILIDHPPRPVKFLVVAILSPTLRPVHERYVLL
jgi:hypothetical protein